MPPFGQFSSPKPTTKHYFMEDDNNQGNFNNVDMQCPLYRNSCEKRENVLRQEKIIFKSKAQDKTTNQPHKNLKELKRTKASSKNQKFFAFYLYFFPFAFYFNQRKKFKI